MRRRPVRAAVAILSVSVAASVLSACSDTPTFVARYNGGNPEVRADLCEGGKFSWHMMRFYRNRDNSPADLMWELQANGSSNVSKVNYGMIPPGFAESFPARPWNASQTLVFSLYNEGGVELSVNLFKPVDLASGYFVTEAGKHVSESTLNSCR